MIRRTALFFLSAAFLIGSAAPVQAQEAEPPVVSDASRQLLEQGIEAFRAERYDEARATFERALDADEDNAEAHYMLSRVYYETPLFDKGAAGREIDAARKLDPDNVAYMVAQLQQLRLPSWNNLAELIQQEKRRALAQQILAVDSTNAFAHEELGATYIRDFWQYRNAIALPTFSLNRDEIGVREDEELGFSPEDQGGSGTLFEDPSAASSTPPSADFGDADALDLTDRFDIETLKSQGVGVLDLSERADVAYEAAIGHLQKALEYDPRRRPVYDHLMRIYTLNEAYSDALSTLERMYVFFPEDPEMWAYLGLANH